MKPEKVWCVQFRPRTEAMGTPGGWCAKKDNVPPTDEDYRVGVETRCDHVVVMPGLIEWRVPSCVECNPPPLAPETPSAAETVANQAYALMKDLSVEQRYLVVMMLIKKLYETIGNEPEGGATVPQKVGTDLGAGRKRK